MSNNDISLSINGKDNASGVLSKVRASTVALGVAAGNLASAGLVKLMNMTRGFVDSALESEKANVMLDASLRSIGKYTPELSAKMKSLADTIQNEIGGSDEYFKDIVSQLLTLGIGVDKVDDATRAITALAAIGKKGAEATKAVARAVEGDYAAFNELIPAVKNATTASGKLAAINATLAAGYAQQQANLQTVGGAWEALKGRLGDAQEGFTNAIFKGLGLATTFNGMQKAVGAFLQGEKWQNFLTSLESGARFAKDIATALTSTGGFKAIGIAIGNVMLAALEDGAAKIEQAIKRAFENTTLSKVKSGAKWLADRDVLAGASRAAGALSAGAGLKEAIAAAFNPDINKSENLFTSGNLKKAIEELKNVVSDQNKKTEENTKAVEDNTEKPAPQITAVVHNSANDNPLQDHRLIANNKQIAAAEQKNGMDALNKQIGIEQNKINAAEQKIANAKAVINDRKTPAQAIADRNQQIAEEKASKDENSKIMQRYNNLKMRQRAAGNMRLDLNDQDQALIAGVEGEAERQKAAEKMLRKGIAEKFNAEGAIRLKEAQLKQFQTDTITELRGIRAEILKAMTAGS